MSNKDLSNDKLYIKELECRLDQASNIIDEAKKENERLSKLLEIQNSDINKLKAELAESEFILDRWRKQALASALDNFKRWNTKNIKDELAEAETKTPETEKTLITN